MAKIESALKHLAKGDFICSVHFPEEFDALQDPVGNKKAVEWLQTIGYRLARLSDEGAFFMAYEVPTVEMRNRFREELKSIRNRLEPYVGFMETFRQAQGRNPQIHAGDVVWLTEISEEVRGSALLERRLSDMRELSDARVADGGATIHRVQRMFNLLESEGYLVETNPTSKGYTFTGKVDYLYQLIAFIAENTPHLSDDEVVDQIDSQMRINETGASSGGAAQP
ncbi:MAG: hypothetical protein ACD_23C00751G0006 [uncultured bacterium]|jgi:hypothetical protein|nr:MAG: hypothetical protein ACD_23C00751G0006 [uncultured bacterium]